MSRCRGLPANSPTGCSAKSRDHGSRLRARRGGLVRGHPRARILQRAVVVLLLAFALAGPVDAQTVPRAPDASTIRVRIGPLWLTPTVNLTNAGVDTNVFNEADPDKPERDFTIGVTPQTDFWLRAGRTWVMGNFREDLVWYKKFSSERSANTNLTLGWLVPANRVAFHVAGNLVHTRERPGFEIDSRSHRTEQAVLGAFELRMLSRTAIGARGERRTIEFDEGEVFRGASLPHELNRTVTSAALVLRNQLTPLTAITLDVGTTQDRFDLSPNRDADSTFANAGVSFDPFALISGSAQLGYRQFKPLSPEVPGYDGLISAVNLTYVALGSTRVNLAAERDVQFSYDATAPYFLQTGFTATLSQQVYGPLDVEGRFGRRRLDYRKRLDTTAALDIDQRIDRVRTFGAGAGYRLGRSMRVGFNVDKQNRDSEERQIGRASCRERVSYSV